MIFHEIARILGGGVSRKSWTFWIPRLCACHPSAWKARGVDRWITWEADPRHSKFIRKSFGVTGRSVATPGVRDKLDDIEGETSIDKEAADGHRRQGPLLTQETGEGDAR